MFSTYQQLKRRRDAGEIDGFTLIELLIVIVVLGILAAVVIFALGGITGKSAVAACQADGATVATAISAFNAQNPGTTVSTTNLLAGSAAGFSGPYLSSWPSNPTHYAYAIVGGTLLMEYPGPASAVWLPTTAAAYTAEGVGTSYYAEYSASGSTGTGTAYSGPASCGGVK
jgi:prepilin-type N-terminal cleavage/methylation domain-containing protein